MAQKKPKRNRSVSGMTYHLNCGRCGGYFTAKRKHAQYCSPRCRKHASRWGVTLFPTK